MRIEKLTIKKILEITEGKLEIGCDVDEIDFICSGSQAENAIYFAFGSKAMSAKCVVLKPEVNFTDANNIIRVQNPRLAFAKLLSHLKTEQKPTGNNVYIAPGAKVADGCILHDNVVIMSGTEIGADSIIYPNVTIYQNTKIGARVRIHANSVVGADGFGYERLSDGNWFKLEHLGRVVIADDVEIGAGVTIDRGTIGDTIIGAGTKIDNQCQIGHNVQIGNKCVISGCTGIAGSTVVEDNVIIGGKVAISDHLHIVSNVMIKGASTVIKNINKPGIYGSAFNVLPSSLWNKCMLIFAKLPYIYKLFKKMEPNDVS